jgi:hypothetical protein
VNRGEHQDAPVADEMSVVGWKVAPRPSESAAGGGHVAPCCEATCRIAEGGGGRDRT